MPPNRPRSRTTAPVRVTTTGRRTQASSPPPAESPERRRMRQRLGLSPSVSDHDLFAAVLAAMPKATSRTTAQRAPAPAPAPLAAPPPRAPLVSAAGPTPAELEEEAAWEEVNARLFGLPTGPATAAARAAGIPTQAQRRSDAYHDRQQALLEEFNRNAAAAHAAQVARIDAARNAAVNASQEARDRAQERLHWPELGR